MTGIKTGTTLCLSGEYRDYNLLYGNNGTSDQLPPFRQSYYMMQLCGCWPNDQELFGDPLFLLNSECTGAGTPYSCCTGSGQGTCTDYTLQVDSPAVDHGDGGYDLNTDCTDVGVPYPCCTGVGSGTCPIYDYGDDISVPPGVGTTDIDMGAYGGPYAIDW